jgi:hypothetical protein
MLEGNRDGIMDGRAHMSGAFGMRNSLTNTGVSGSAGRRGQAPSATAGGPLTAISVPRLSRTGHTPDSL